MPRRSPPVSRDLLDAALSLVLTLAQAIVAGADGVGITLARHGRPTTVAASAGEVLELDHEQNTSGAGPSLDATHGRRVHVDSLAAETRWPAFVRTARARGVETVLSIPLVAANRPIGALTVYSHTVGSLTAGRRDGLTCWRPRRPPWSRPPSSAVRMSQSVSGSGRCCSPGRRSPRHRA